MEINKVYNKDCILLLDEMIKEGQMVDCVITDPPYLINYKTNHRKDKEHKFCKTIANDNNPELISDVVERLYEVMKPDTALYMFCGSDKVDFFKQEVEKFFTVKNIIVWDKGNWTAGDLEAQFGKQYEFIIYANKGRAKFNESVTRYSDVWRIPREVGASQIHQNQKPENIINRMLKIHTKEGDVVLDPFMGSFTTAVACHKMKRNFIGAELDKEYWELGQKRLESEQNQISLFDL